MKTRAGRMDGTRRGLAALLLLMCGWVSADAQVAGQPGAPGPMKTYTNKTFFHLPIEIDARSRELLREIVLYVKSGAGNWERKVVAPPAQDHFSYKVAQDGEYWFNVVTVDKQGRANPADVTREAPALMVVVDTQPPTAEVTQIRLADGDLALRCSVRDTAPDYQKVVLAYLGLDQVWHDMPPVTGLQGTYRLPSQPVVNGSFRYTAADLAGNTTTQVVNIDLDKQAAGPHIIQASQNVPAPAEQRSAYRPDLSTPPAAAPVTPPANPFGPNLVPEKAAAPSNAFPQNPASVRIPVPGAHPLQPEKAPVPAFHTGQTTATPKPFPVTEPAPQQTMQTSVTPQAPREVSGMGGPDRQLINTRRASIDYRLDKVGPSGISKVDVWIIGDRGSPWQRIATDHDRRTPVEVEFPGDGLYGLRLAVTNGNGFGGNAPLANDNPDFWMEVDTTSPFAQLRDIDPSTGGGHIEIRWTASDKNLGPEPVALFYAVQQGGPWQPIARNIKNEGHYSWNFPRNIGSQFYLRLEVADLAGNVTHAETPSPITLDLTEPRALVVGVTGLSANPVIPR